MPEQTPPQPASPVSQPPPAPLPAQPTNKLKLTSLALAVILAAGGLYLLITNKRTPQQTSTVCGGWNTGGEIICNCNGSIIKDTCPKNAVCDSGNYYCTGQCGSCCWKGLPDNTLYPRCQN